jgi:hypothetical protein
MGSLEKVNNSEINSNELGNTSKKEEIIKVLQQLEVGLKEYLIHWKENGGGTTGHAIGSAIKKSEELNRFFTEYC